MTQNGKSADISAYEKEFKEWKTYQMSDHLPLWIEFDINFSEDYLKSLIAK